MADISMSAQRKRRAQRMANRPRRLAQGPVSDHGDEILQAIELVKAKQEAEAYPGGDFLETKDQETHTSEKSTSIVSHCDSQSAPQTSVHENKSVDEEVIKMLQTSVTCQTLKLSDLSTFDMGWTVKSLVTLVEIGRGSYGRVLLARHRSTGVPLAVKEPSWSDDFMSPGEMVEELKATRTRATKEALIQQLLSGSPYFPKFWGTLDLGNELCQAVEFIGCKKTGTGYPLHAPPRLSVSNVVKIAEDIVKGMKEFHDHGLLHNDLKNDNVLLEKRGKRYNAVVIDFGMASTMTAPAKMVGVTKELKMAYVHGGEADYIAPEVVLDEQPTSVASDVFSIGRIFSDMGEIFEDLHSPVVRTLTKIGSECMANDPDHRPSLDTIQTQIDKLQRPSRWRRVKRWFAKKLHLRRK
ncbi:dual specificity testis-specific protein kinase 2-like [Lytechinus variegatus]|uniref:dual specificity testis-specific protein kinase 2-like n=2 Tax=Lytechinus variegatus TaxID=7654 RepID=UPI001BB1FA0C|nr:dual specificity testis-specific protein kinase 2-like [Lytechinus variegatus]